MVMAAAPCVSPESSPARPATLKRRLAAVAGAAGAAAIGASDAQAVPYTPTAGIAAASGIPGFSFVDASNVTLGALRPPPTAGGAGSAVTNWDVDNSGTSNFDLLNASTYFAYFTALGAAGFHTAGNNLNIRNIATGVLVGPALTAWGVNVAMTGNGANSQSQFNPLGSSGQFGFRFNTAADTYYGWASLVIDGTGSGQGFLITEAYYNTTPGAAISVGQVPVVVPEPSSMALLGLDAAGVAAWRARRKSQATAESPAQ